MSKIKISYCGFFNSSGYSFSCQNYIWALHKSGHFDIKIHIFGDRPSKPAVSDEAYEFFMKMVKKEEEEDRILIYHCIPNLQRRIKPKGRNIGFGVFETFSPPENWIKVLNKNDAVIVPSHFNYKVFSHTSLQKPIYHIPHCINIDLYHKDVKPLNNYSRYSFLFMGTWKNRKGYKQLLEAWFREFTDKDNVQLIIKTEGKKKPQEYADKLKKEMGIKQGFAPILFENKILDEKTLPRYIKSADCLVSPHMGEGFGYPGLQCMALGIPVIITDFSGSQDYANEDTAVLLKPNGFVLKSSMDRVPQFQNKKWAFIEVKQIQQSMRYVFKNPDIIKAKVGTAYNYVRKKFNYSEIGNKFRQMISELYGNI